MKPMCEKGRQKKIHKGPQLIVGAVILNSKKEVLVVRGDKWGDYWTIPGGKVETGETLIDALMREVKEEISLEVQDCIPLGHSESVYDPNFMSGKEHMVFVDYGCLNYTGNLIIDKREISEYRWVAFDQVKKLEMTVTSRNAINRLFNHLTNQKSQTNKKRVVKPRSLKNFTTIKKAK